MTRDRSWVRRTTHRLLPDPTRVVARLFLPGQEPQSRGASRSVAVLDRVLALSDAEVTGQLASLHHSFTGRHRDLDQLWERHHAMVEHRLAATVELTDERKRLVGAAFTSEFSIEGASLFNPSIVAHPDQSGLAPGSLRFLMTLRAVGEGHVSSVEIRTGTLDAESDLTWDPAPEFAVLPDRMPVTYARSAFARQLADHGRDRTNSDYVLGTLPEQFSREELTDALTRLHDERLTRGPGTRTIDRLGWIADCTYSVRFPDSSSLQERVLMPIGPSESQGMEDVRLVRLETPDGVVYAGSYTAYDGRSVGLQLMRTHDFQSFDVTRLTGPGSRDKGLALFPRQVCGRYLALTRADRESNGISTSADLLHWETPVRIQTAQEPWEIIQLGNCGPPIETERGWLVLTHGVGAMREYRIGALLLDLDDPTVVLGRLTTPLLSPTDDERSGYVPNVVYSCGALLHGRTIVLPYGCSDQTTRIALVALDPLLDALVVEHPESL